MRDISVQRRLELDSIGIHVVGQDASIGRNIQHSAAECFVGILDGAGSVVCIDDVEGNCGHARWSKIDRRVCKGVGAKEICGWGCKQKSHQAVARPIPFRAGSTSEAVKRILFGIGVIAEHALAFRNQKQSLVFLNGVTVVHGQWWKILIEGNDLVVQG